jgi:hypothetical protein
MELATKLDYKSKYMKKLDIMVEKDLRKKENMIKQRLNIKDKTNLYLSSNGLVQINPNNQLI